MKQTLALATGPELSFTVTVTVLTPVKSVSGPSIWSSPSGASDQIGSSGSPKSVMDFAIQS